jgi:hypothetical protein
MSSDVPDWVRLACNRWGRQKRRIWTGKDWHGNVDGYAQSLLGRIRDERDGCGQGARSQHWPEVFWADGLDVQRTLMGQPERQYAVLHFQHVWDPEWGITAAKKASYLDLKRTEYFELVEKAEVWVHARLEGMTESSDSQLVERVSEIVRKALHSGSDKATKAHHGESVLSDTSDLNLVALKRPKLTFAR